MNHSMMYFLSLFLFSFFICFSYSFNNTTLTRCSRINTHALLSLKQDLLSYNHSDDEIDYRAPRCHDWLGSDYYPIMMNWNTSINCCNWDGVTCNQLTGDVVALDLSCGMLQGTIHPNSTLFNLPHLQTLNLAYNKLTNSQLPQEIGRFSNSLTHLNISNSGFTGQVPTNITILHKLVSLDLSWNNLKLEPHVFYNLLHTSTSLEELTLTNVNISSILPAYLNVSSSMRSLHLSFTSLLGKLPDNIFNLPYLEELELSFNKDITDQLPKVYINTSIPLMLLDLSNTNLSGEIFNPIRHLKSLNYLDLSYTSLLGEISDSIGHLKSLNYLDLSKTNISGKIPDSIDHLESLTHLILSRTDLLGEIPDSIGRLKSLIRLDLSYTNLSGEIPYSFAHLESLNELDLSSTNISGEIPDSIGHIESLNELDLSNTNLSGEIPYSIGYLKSLIRLDLSNTKLSGEIPGSIGHLKSLIRLDLSHTNLSGEIPDSIGHLKSLFFLFLSNTNLSGEIPNAIGNLKSLLYLFISNTNLSGEIPDSIRHLKFLISLDLHSNLIQGPFPPLICNMSNLMHLDMSNNRFGGVIPQCLGNISSYLEVVDLGNNSFQGPIPNAWDDCGGLQGLVLNGNSLEGEVPSGLSKCKSLKVLDLGNNHLNGTFPHWSANLSNLQVLVLKSNKFHGPIESSSIIKHQFSSLKVLDLSRNKFVGNLPRKYFQNFDAMKNLAENHSTPEYVTVGDLIRNFYSITAAVKGSDLRFPKISVDYTIIDLSNNIFEGKIPNIIGSLNSLIVLNLSHNNLNGRIPNALGNLSEIESLDLSCNRLTEEIPRSLAVITTLEVLNLSQNQLVGRIPDGTQFKTFGATSFEGNPGLCGFPLPNCEHPSHVQLEVDEDEDSGFTWKVVMLGYGCGTLLGMLMGYMMLSTGRPKWFNEIADAIEFTVLVRRRKRRHVYIGK